MFRPKNSILDFLNIGVQADVHFFVRIIHTEGYKEKALLNKPEWYLTEPSLVGDNQ